MMYGRRIRTGVEKKLRTRGSNVEQQRVKFQRKREKREENEDI